MLTRAALRASGVAKSKLLLSIMPFLLLATGAQAARNVILMIGDGMSFQQVNAGSYYLNGAAGTLSFEGYFKCSVTTRSLNDAITDSSAAGSALATGHKINNNMVSVSPAGEPYTTILEIASAQGKSTGLVTTDPITRATPAAFGSHNVSRYSYLEIGDDYLQVTRPQVLLGGGATASADSEFFSNAQIAYAASIGYTTVFNVAELATLNATTERALGLFSLQEMPYEYDGYPPTMPHLHQMAATALDILDSNPEGFFLMVEGAKIDWASHARDIQRTTQEVIEFDNTVRLVLDWMRGRGDTLLLVTGDHETGGLKVTNQGKGKYAAATWSATDHTAADVPLYAYGPDAELVDRYIVNGKIDNTEIFQIMHTSFGVPVPEPPLRAALPLAGQLQLRAIARPCGDLGVTAQNMFNGRYFDGAIYANQINTPCFGRYASGSSVPEMLVNNAANTGLEHRLVAPFRGNFKTSYLLGSSSAMIAGSLMTRYNFDGSHPVSVDTPGRVTVDAFDWAEDDLLIYAVYTSGHRNRLYLADVTAEPFSVKPNTRWNMNGYVTTSVTERIRNVRRGDVFSGYAYYGDAGQNNNPKFYALNLATGVETLLGGAGQLTGSGSFGVWTVLERGGYLYVQTTDNGIQVYELVNATTLGALLTIHTKPQLDALTGGSVQYWGLDVSADGEQLLLSGGNGQASELEGRPALILSHSGGRVKLSWPASVSAMVVQATTDLAAGFSDLDPQPEIVVEDGKKTVTIPLAPSANQAYFRLAK